MKLIRKRIPINTFATCAGAGGIAALDEEVLDDAVEDGVVVVALEAELDEVPYGLGRFLRPELDVERAVRRVQHHLPLRRRLQHVHGRHLLLESSPELPAPISTKANLPPPAISRSFWSSAGEEEHP